MSNKKIFYTFLLCALTLPFNFCAAAAAKTEIKDYFTLPGIGTITDVNNFFQFSRYLFGFGVYISGTIVVLSLTWGAIRYMTSAGNPQARSDGLDRMRGSMLGLLIVLGSYLFATIPTNENIGTQTNTQPLPSLGGLFYVKGDEKQLAPWSNNNLTNMPESLNGFDSLKYECAGASDSPMWIWKYPKPDLKGNDEDYSGATMEELACGQTTGLPAGSYETTSKSPGVYFCMGENGSGYCSHAMTSDIYQMPDPFAKKMKSIKIVNSQQKNINYGIVLFEGADPTRASVCDQYMVANGDGESLDVGIKPLSAKIFRLNKDYKSSGDGVILFSQPYGWSTNSLAGYYWVYNDEIKPVASFDRNKVEFDYDLVNVAQEVQEYCDTFDHCPGSIRIKGNYLVLLMHKYGGKPVCQVFTKDVNDVLTEDIDNSALKNLTNRSSSSENESSEDLINLKTNLKSTIIIIATQ